MSTTIRSGIALLLALLLPLQAGAVVARSAAMSAQHATHAGAPSLQLAHAIGVPHQHGAHSHNDKLPNKKASKSSKARVSQQAKANCHDGAKCCLLGASAPPSVINACFDPAMVRAAYLPYSVPVVEFITGGPDRPPRFLKV
jgi:hypothetical protein